MTLGPLSLQTQVTNIVSQMSPPDNTTASELKCSFEVAHATQLQLGLGYKTEFFFFSTTHTHIYSIYVHIHIHM